MTERTHNKLDGGDVQKDLLFSVDFYFDGSFPNVFKFEMRRQSCVDSSLLADSCFVSCRVTACGLWRCSSSSTSKTWGDAAGTELAEHRLLRDPTPHPTNTIE